MTPEEALKLLKSRGIIIPSEEEREKTHIHKHNHHFEKTHECHVPHFYHVNHLADKFHVVTIVSNPVMYKSRLKSCYV